MIHVVYFTKETRWEWILLRMSLLVSLWLFVWAFLCVSVSDADRREEGEKVTPSIFTLILIYLICLSNLFCFFRSSRKFLHLWFQAPSLRALEDSWGKCLITLAFFFYIFCLIIVSNIRFVEFTKYSFFRKIPQLCTCYQAVLYKYYLWYAFFIYSTTQLNPY